MERESRGGESRDLERVDSRDVVDAVVVRFARQ